MIYNGISVLHIHKYSWIFIHTQYPQVILPYCFSQDILYSQHYTYDMPILQILEHRFARKLLGFLPPESCDFASHFMERCSDLGKSWRGALWRNPSDRTPRIHQLSNLDVFPGKTPSKLVITWWPGVVFFPRKDGEHEQSAMVFVGIRLKYLFFTAKKRSWRIYWLIRWCVWPCFHDLATCRWTCDCQAQQRGRPFVGA